MDKSQQTSLETRNFFGDIMSLVALSPFHDKWTMEKIKRVFVPPLKCGQFRLFYQSSVPNGFCCWAWVSDEILNLLQNKNYKLQPQDWQSGKNLWLAEFIAPNGNTREIVRNMRRFVLSNYGENIKGQWFRPTKNKQGFAMSGKKVA
jgi:cytolysin-activating lysine-acyltransferase